MCNISMCNVSRLLTCIGVSCGRVGGEAGRVYCVGYDGDDMRADRSSETCILTAGMKTQEGNILIHGGISVASGFAA